MAIKSKFPDFQKLNNDLQAVTNIVRALKDINRSIRGENMVKTNGKQEVKQEVKEDKKAELPELTERQLVGMQRYAEGLCSFAGLEPSFCADESVKWINGLKQGLKIKKLEVEA